MEKERAITRWGAILVGTAFLVVVLTGRAGAEEETSRPEFKVGVSPGSQGPCVEVGLEQAVSSGWMTAEFFGTGQYFGESIGVRLVATGQAGFEFCPVLRRALVAVPTGDIRSPDGRRVATANAEAYQRMVVTGPLKAIAPPPPRPRTASTETTSNRTGSTGTQGRPRRLHSVARRETRRTRSRSGIASTRPRVDQSPALASASETPRWIGMGSNSSCRALPRTHPQSSSVRSGP